WKCEGGMDAPVEAATWYAVRARARRRGAGDSRTRRRRREDASDAGEGLVLSRGAGVRFDSADLRAPLDREAACRQAERACEEAACRRSNERGHRGRSAHRDFRSRSRRAVGTRGEGWWRESSVWRQADLRHVLRVYGVVRSST